MEKLGAIALSSDIFEKANIGLWAFELDEGSAPRMYVDDTMLKLIGLEKQISPEETYHAWYDHIDPEHYGEVSASVDKMVAGVHAEVQYPWHHPNGDVWIVRCGGVRNFEYKKGIRIEGTHQNVTDVAHFQKAKLGTIALDAGILTKANIGLWAFELDEGSQPRMYADEAMLKLIGLEEQVSPEETYHAWYDNIDPEHYGEVAASVEKMTAGIHAEVQYPWHHPNGTVWTVRCGGVRNYAYTKGIRIEGTHQNVTDVSHFEKEKIEELSLVIEAMASDYEVLIHADLDADVEQPYRVSGHLMEAVKEWETDTSYTGRVKSFAEKLVIPEDREQFLHDTSPAVMWEKVKGGKPYVFYYRVNLGGRVQWFQSKCVHSQSHGERNCAIIGISNNDEAMNRSMRERALVEALGEDFSYVSYIDPMNGEEIIDRYEEAFMAKVPGWQELTDYSQRLRAICETMIHPDDRERFLRETSLENLAKSLLENPVMYLNFRELIDGEVRYYQGKFVLVDIDGTKNVVIGYRSVDAETRRQLAYQEELSAARNRAEAANDAKSTFLFNMSHDIRTPMNAIIGFNNMAMAHIDDKEKAMDCLQKVGTSSRHLLSLINDVLDMARIESGNVKCEYQPLCLSETAEQLIEMVRETAPKGLAIQSDFSAITHDHVLADQVHLNRILTNVISNAVKYTPAGGTVRYTVRETSACCEGHSSYDFIVEDTGIGMSEEFLRHIFEEFSREKSSTQSGIQGTGLGMAITKRLVDLLGGTICIESERGVGTKVTIHLDMEIIEPAETGEAASEPADLSVLRGKRILLVEDNELNREIAADILEEYGLDIDLAEDGSIAVEKCRAAGETDGYDLILMDIQMPVMDGYAATKEIRMLLRQNVPIVAMTANAFDEDKKKALECGMNAHIAKPIDRKTLEKVLTAQLRRRRG